eukprot:PhF_6_TR19810/c0_g1_i2/m.28884
MTSRSNKRSKDEEEVKGGKESPPIILFRSACTTNTEYSNFWPFVKHKEITGVELHIPVQDPRNPEVVHDCASVEAAYLLNKALMMDYEYASTKIIPIIRGDALAVKRLGGKGVYVDWKCSKTKGVKKEIEEAYKTSEREFHKVNTQIMLQCLWSKFHDHPELKEFMLRAPDHVELHEIGRPSYWTRAGSDMLGKLLMHVRGHLRRGTANLVEVFENLPQPDSK